MPRIRSIKPETWTDEKLGRISRDSRLLFIATWSAADDYGNLRGSPALLRAFAFPYDDVTIADVERWTSELVSAGMLIPYLANGEHCLSIRHWTRHHRPPHPRPGMIPPIRHGRGLVVSSRTYLSPSTGIVDNSRAPGFPVDRGAGVA